MSLTVLRIASLIAGCGRRDFDSIDLVRAEPLVFGIEGAPCPGARLLTMQPVGVHHVSLNVDDVDAALRFYVDVLGCSVRSDRPDFGFAGAWLDVGGQQIHLIEGVAPADNGQHVAIHVDDIEAAIAELRGKGVEVSDAFPVGTGRQAFLHDPAANLVELQQPGS